MALLYNECSENATRLSRKNKKSSKKRILAIDKQSKREYNVFRNTNGGDKVQDLVFDTVNSGEESEKFVKLKKTMRRNWESAMFL